MRPVGGGRADIVEKVKKGYKAGAKTFEVHLDGYNLMPFLRGEAEENPRKASSERSKAIWLAVIQLAWKRCAF